jgi:hypothetical protein
MVQSGPPPGKPFPYYSKKGAPVPQHPGPEFPGIQQDMPATKATWFYFSSTEAPIPHLSLGLQPFVDFVWNFSGAAAQ